MNTKRFFTLIVSLSLGVNCAFAQQSVNVIPQPVFSELKNGIVSIGPQTEIVLINKDASRTVAYLNDYLSKWTGYKLKIVNQPVNDPAITQIIYDIKVKADAPDEAYGIKAKDNSIRLMGDARGLFNATQTLLQLMEQNASSNRKKISFPACDIYDYPRFQYRGMHLDVGRHFFSVDFVKRYIDLMALYKFNTFHWHLTEDQGWRIEIKKYPRLTQIGSIRKQTVVGKKFNPFVGDSTPHGGYYTQDQIREVVKYAADRQITIIPEIEMPGHALAALASYPYLGCTKGPYEVATRWGVFPDVFCAGNDSTFTFLENVLDEVIQLFPGKYIHIGGDECPKTRWEKCAKCQERIRQLGLKDEHALQSYFIQRIEKYLNAKGRKIIGWDEILEGGLAPNATVMSWRGEEGGITAAQQHHDVVMTPGKYVYLDHYQSRDSSEPLAIGGFLPLNVVYGYEPIPAKLSAEEAKYIKGAQGNVWTEYMPTESQVEYMVYPRAIALSEVLWSQQNKKNYDNFLNRLKIEMKRLDRLKVNYAKHALGINGEVSRTREGIIELAFSTRLNGARIRYTNDGSEPAPNSDIYLLPLAIGKSMTIRARPFLNDQPYGNEYRQAFIIHKAAGKKVISRFAPAKDHNPGSDFALVDGIEGSENSDDNNWFGFSGNDLDAVIDFDRPVEISSFGINFINNPRARIYPPSSLSFSVSNDGMVFRNVASKDSFENKRLLKIRMDIASLKARYVRVLAKNAGKIPQGKPGAGNDAWLFVDELLVF